MRKHLILYWDANALYSSALCQKLPLGHFEWADQNFINHFDILATSEDDELAYFLEVDLEYPDELHESHSDYPLCPEHKSVTMHELSPYQQDLLTKLKLKGSHKSTRKLIPNLYNKQKYVVHSRALRFYLEHGIVLTTIYRIIKFQQAPIFRGYIEFNMAQRAISKNSFSALLETPFQQPVWKDTTVVS